MTRNDESKQSRKASRASAGDASPGSAAITQFRAPAVTEANGDGTLDPADCPDGAHVVTGNDIETGVGDSVTLTWQGTTVDGQAAAPYTQAKTIASSKVNKPVKLDPVPLARITALAGGTVDVSYTVTTSGGTKTGASLVNTLQVRKQDKPQATFKVRGCRGPKMAQIASSSLVAVDGVVGLPVTAQWQYKGDSRSVIAERLVDMHPEKILTVTANGAVVRLAPVSIASAFGPNDGVSTVVLNAVAVRLDDGTIASWLFNGKDPKNYLPNELATVNDVVAIFATLVAFAALRRDGSVVAWGYPNNGGSMNGGSMPADIARLTDIVCVCASMNAFAAIRSDGSVWAWPGPSSDPGSYMTHSSSTLAVYPFNDNAGSFRASLCLDEDHRLSILGGDDKIPKEIQGRVTWTL